MFIRYCGLLTRTPQKEHPNSIEPKLEEDDGDSNRSCDEVELSSIGSVMYDESTGVGEVVSDSL